MKKNYIKIQFKNCSVDYDYTIVPLEDVDDHIGSALAMDFEDVNEDDFEAAKEIGNTPQIILTPVQMTNAEYNKWFKDNVEKNA